MKFLRKMLIWVTILYGIIFVSAYFFQEKVLFHNVRLPADFTYNFPDTFKEVWFSPEKDLKINALHFKVDSAKGLVFYLHGNADNLVRWGKHAQDFTKNGYEVLMVDYRTFGKSTGTISQESDLHQDMAFVYRKLLEKYKEENIVIYGRSLGTGLATKLASENHPKMLILETPYYEMKEVGNHYFPLLPYDFLLRYRLPTYLWIQKVKCPVYIFHGTEDGVVPYKSGQKLAKLLGKPEILTTIQGGEHKNLANFPEYHTKLKELLK